MVSAAEFKANCLELIEQMEQDGEPITVTKDGKPVAVLGPTPKRSEPAERRSPFGALKNAVYRFDDPFSPAFDGDWDAELGKWEPNR